MEGIATTRHGTGATAVVRAAIEAEPFSHAVRRHLRTTLARTNANRTTRDLLLALSFAVRDRLLERMIETEERFSRAGAKQCYYLSMEFLVGRSLHNNLLNLGLLEDAREAAAGLGGDLDQILDEEDDAALGNGGLGRLAACFLDSAATMDMPVFGYGINYEYGCFRQVIDNGWQREYPDTWRQNGTPWLVEQPGESFLIPVYGRLAREDDEGIPAAGSLNGNGAPPAWVDVKTIIGVPSDMPVAGYGGRTVNHLRLYAARASRDFDIRIFNSGDYVRAVEQKITTETVSKVLYPSDAASAGRELRLVQEYFFVACAVRDITRRFDALRVPIEEFPRKVAIQLNDTHPALAVAELMRMLVDERAVAWEKAWEITRETFGYTNHTLMPEALERFAVPLLRTVIPRHLDIVFEINRRFLGQVAEVWPGDAARSARMSLVEEGDPKHVRMAHLAIAGSHSVNGVAAIHTELVKTTLVPDFHALWPERFNNKTNGVTPRRWILLSNPGLAKLLDEAVGGRWVTHLESLARLQERAGDQGFLDAFAAVKDANKGRLAALIEQTCGVGVDTSAIFDIQVKRIHEYKRQLLNVMHIIHVYLSLVEDGRTPAAPRLWAFGGKAAPGYHAAKLVIRLINGVADTINADPRARDWLRVVFIPDYRVTQAEQIIPGADISEQISTAGTEASGTGNMKFAMNGAVTVGTLDGANIEIMQAVGPENILIFGHTKDELAKLSAEGYYPREIVKRDPVLRRVMEAIYSTMFSDGDAGLFAPLYESVVEKGDRYFHLADLPRYIEAQERAAAAWQDRPRWNRMALMNTALTGGFSSDRTVREYAQEIWNLKPVPAGG